VKVLCCGDVMARSGRRAVLEQVPRLRERLGLDFVLVNGENAAHGFGITAKICQTFFEAGVDVITTGNHVWDQREIIDFIGGEPRLLRPLNLPDGTPGRGAGVFRTASGRDVLVVHPMGKLFMPPVEDPFQATEAVLAKHRLGTTVAAILVDIHAEASSEKMGLAQHLDGRVSAAVGSHSHVPTADAQILPGGTAYQTDMGMCGDYDSVIGMKKDVATRRFLGRDRDKRLEPAEGEGTFCAVYVETDDQSGLASSVAPIRLGGRLREAAPWLAS